MKAQIIFVDSYVELTTTTTSKTANIYFNGYNSNNYDILGATFVQNTDLFYFIATDGIIPLLNIGTVNNIQVRYYVELIATNKSTLATTTSRKIYVRAIFKKK